MEKQQGLMIDMDDVIVKGGFLYLINQYLGTHYTEKDFKHFYMQDVIPDKQDFFRYFLTKNMYDYCEMNANAYKVIKELNDAFKIYIGTSYIFPEIPRESGIILVQKYNYLMDKLPFLTPNNFVFLVDKSVLNCEIRIDDKVDNLDGAERKLLYTAYHNRDISNKILQSQGIERAEDWLEVKKLLLKR
ncbi:MAG: hypothetical protein PHD03_03850 [Bacilli bacterium]|nr:hypothetical protein [Bacilli bacterium]MDD4407224.1 hypothetical protein [Bacilli bacterium]